MKISDHRARAALVFLLAFLIIWSRATIRLEQGFLWAEDAPIFILQAHQLGLRAMLTNYAGYLHLIPRLIAETQRAILPLSSTPYFFVWCCAALTSGACAYIAFALRQVTPVTAAFMGLAPVLAPQNGEVLLSITYLQWVLLPALLVLLWEAIFGDQDRRPLPRAIAVGLLALTGPFGVLLVPAVAIAIALRRLRPRGGSINWPIVVTYFVAVAVQTLVMLRNPQDPKGVHDVPWLTWMIQAMFTDYLPSVLATTASGCLFAVLLIGVCVLSRARLVFACLFCFGVLLWGLGVTRVVPPVQIAWYGTGARYVYPWGIFMLWTLTLSIVNPGIKSLKPLAAVLIFLILLASGERFEAQLLQKWEILSSATSYHVTVPPGWSIDVAR
ncbi:conserved hypothetical protein [Paraburkholderia atlantica]|uniref:Transmembrane protein n=1 Tax=Paraburkholderia atlantica TaxID=2654982 RepID=D5WBP0_PARAM|nr:hypothetical protein [Paraburkholderia atlantica]ADG16418.1 conserved hypothetical protein [Paraburkholderia atlantica]